MVSTKQAGNIRIVVGDDYTAVLTIGAMSVALSSHDLHDLATVAPCALKEARDYFDELLVSGLDTTPD